MRFSTKLAVLFSSILVIVFTVVLYIVYSYNITALKNEISKRLIQNADNYTSNLDMIISERLGDIMVLASDSIITNRLSTSAEISARLKAFKISYPIYGSLSFFDLNRLRLADTLDKDVGKVHTLSEYWPEILKGRDFVVSVDRSESLGEPTVHFSAKVWDKRGLPVGVVVSRITVSNLFSMLKSKPKALVDTDKDVKLTLVDRAGRILYSDYNSASSYNTFLHDWQEINKLIDGGQSGMSLLRKNILGEDVITVFTADGGSADFGHEKWTLLLNIKTSRAFATATNMRYAILVIFLASGAVGLLAIYIFSRRVTNPIISIRNAAVKVGDGNLDIELSRGSNDEIGDLADSFNGMVRELRCSRDKLVSYSQEMKEGKKRLEEAQRIAHIGNIYFDTAYDNFYCSDEAYRILEIGEDERGPFTTFGLFMELINPEDREKVGEAIRAADAGSAFSDMDVRLNLRSGDKKTVCMKSDVKSISPSMQPVFIWTLQDVTERKFIEEELKRLATTDSLTGACNRLKFKEALPESIKVATRYGRPLSLAILDIDHFKAVNDTYGHNQGDNVLRSITIALKEQIREKNNIFRWGGEEFAIIIPETGIKEALTFVERLRRTVEGLNIEIVGRVTVSIGVAELKSNDTVDTLVHRADCALYAAKENGRNRVEAVL